MQNQRILINFTNISPFLRYIHQDIYINKSYRVPWRILYDYELVYVYEGVLHVQTDNDEYTVSAGEVHIMPPFVHHRRYNVNNENLRLYSIHFDLLDLGNKNDFSADVYVEPCNRQTPAVDINEQLAHRPYHSLENVTLPRKMKILDPIKFLEILGNTLDAYEEKLFGYELDMKAGVLRLLRIIISDYHSVYINKGQSERSKKISWFIAYMRNHYNEQIDFDNLSKQQNISYSYFRRLLKEMTGYSPTEYLINIRIEKAIEFLRKGVYTVSEICYMVGYDDIHYFSKLFKDKTGVPPSLFLKQEAKAKITQEALVK